MNEITFPAYPFRLRGEGEDLRIFDEVRKKWLKLSPEEWVRQHLVMYLHHYLGYPLTLMSLEKEIRSAAQSLRPDLVIYSRQGQPILLAECKAPAVKTGNDTFAQAAAYNRHFNVPYLLITNGINHYCAKISNGVGSFTFLESIPRFEEL
jgi:hypothetical protein